MAKWLAELSYDREVLGSIPTDFLSGEHAALKFHHRVGAFS